MKRRLKWQLLALFLSAGFNAAQAQAVVPPHPLESLYRLTGACWVATLPTSVADAPPVGASAPKDIQCFEDVFGGLYVRSKQHYGTTGGDGSYCAETLFYVNPAAGGIEYLFFNSNNQRYSGTLRRIMNGYSAPAQPYDFGGETLSARYEVTVTSANEWVTRYVEDGGDKRVLWQARYQRTDDVSPAMLKCDR